MKDPLALARAVEEAWADVPAPSVDALRALGCLTHEEADTFIGVAPMDVDIDSEGFLAATPLENLPAQAAGAYLGTFLRAVMMSLHYQHAVQFFEDPLTRAHLIICLKDDRFWAGVVEPHVAGKQREVLLEVVECMVQARDDLGLDTLDVKALRARVASAGNRGR